MNWKEVRLEDCCVSITDGDHQPPPKSDTGIPFITIANINSFNKIDFTSSMHVPKDYYFNLNGTKRPSKDDILYSVVGSFGIPVFLKEDIPFVFQRHIALLRPNKDIIYPKFLYYKMLSRDFYQQADTVAIGAAQRTIGLASLRKMTIVFPVSYKDQEKIANALSAYDDLIENNQKQIKLLEEAAQRLYKEWFVDLRFPGHEQTRIVDGVPEGWEKGLLKNIVQFLSGFAFKSESFNIIGKYKIVTIKNVQDGHFDGVNVEHIDQIPNSMPKHCYLTEGDMLLSLTGNVGRICIVVGEGYLLNQRVAKIQTNFPCYTYCLLKSREMFIKLNNLANGAAQQNLSPVRTESSMIYIPPLELLQSFEKIALPMFKRILVLNNEMLRLTEARDRLLPKIMNGEIEL